MQIYKIMKAICNILYEMLFFLPLISYSQRRIVRVPPPTSNELMMFQIQLNPSDTIFNSVDFSYLPVKAFPLFTANPSVNHYTIQERDSILRRIDELFFEQ